MKKLLPKLIALITLGSLIACSTDVDLNAAYEDITVVYGLLNQNDSIHYVKVNKAFLGDDNALLMAQDATNSSYGDEIEVVMEEYQYGNIVNTYNLDTAIINNKEEGVFYYPQQVVYTFDKYRLNPQSSYRLVINNLVTGKVVSAESGLIQKFSIDKPSSGQKFIGFTAESSKSVEWTSAVNGRIYEVWVKFFYHEKNISSGAIDSNKYINWYLGSERSADIDGGEPLQVLYFGENFYKTVGGKLTADLNLKRVAGRVHFIIQVADDNFAIYLDVNGPNNSIVENRPEYTNINNGIGLFASRYDNTVDRDRSYTLLERSIDSLVKGQYTYDLGFDYSF